MVTDYELNYLKLVWANAYEEYINYRNENAKLVFKKVTLW